MHDEPRSDLEERALAAWRPTEPPADFAERVLKASRREAPRPALLGRLLAAGGARLAAGLAVAAAAATLAYAVATRMSSRTDPPAPAVEVPGDAPPGATQGGALPTAARPAAPALVLPSDLEDRIDRYLAGYGARYGDAFKFHGVVRVLKDGEVVATRVQGPADRDSGAPNGPQTRFKIGSLTHIFTAAAVLQLRDAGRLDLDDPLRKHLPDYPQTGAQVTLRHLLSHTSGIPSYTDHIFSVGKAGPVAPQRVRALFQDLPLEFPPGADFDLSNSGYFLLGQVVEAVARQPFADYVAQNLLAPAGMRSSGVGAPADARGYAFDEAEILVPAVQRHPSAYGGAGALVATADDLTLWDRALRRPGLVLSERSLREMITEVREDYGLGWFLRREGGRTLAFYPGGVEGYNATIARSLDDGLTVFALANTEAVDTRTVVYDVLRLAAGEEALPPPEHVEVALASSGLLARYVGEYELTQATIEALRPLFGEQQLGSLAQVRVHEREGRLLLSVPDHATKWMHPLGEDRFFFKDPAGTLAEFGPPGASVGRLTLEQQGVRFVLRRVR